MKYFIDTEFIEGPQDKRIFGFKVGETKPTIDLISIGIVAEDGGEYYAISKDFNIDEAWNRYDLNYGSGDQRNYPPRKVYWIRENILKPVYKELRLKELNECNFNVVGIETYFKGDKFLSELKRLISKYGRSNKDIAEDIIKFVHKDVIKKWDDKISFYDQILDSAYNQGEKTEHQFYAYYADYDWVVFCWIFGKMMNLPKGFPMYCIDLKQQLDEYCELKRSKPFELRENYLEVLKKDIAYPKQENEHNALDDAKWNKALYDYLQAL